MLIQQKSHGKWYSSVGVKITAFVTLTLLALMAWTQQALAHHPTGGNTPTTWGGAFLSGLGHPVIGIDHLAFVIASGLLAVQLKRGFSIPLSFILTAMLGTGIYLAEINLPVAEILIAASVIGAGVLVALQTKENFSQHLIAIAIASGVAGLFHGYAYGEAIVGAEMGPLIAYLAGFTAIQLAIAGGAYKLGQLILKQFSQKQFLVIRFLGIAISGIGIVFLGTSLFG